MQTTAEKPSDSPPPRGGRGAKPRRHRATKVQPLTRASLDGRTNAAKTFNRIVCGIENDLGGHDQLSTVEAALIEAFAGATVHVNKLNALLLLGKAIDLADHAAAISAMVRVAARIGLRRRPRDVTPTVEDYMANINANQDAAK